MPHGGQTGADKLERQPQRTQWPNCTLTVGLWPLQDKVAVAKAAAAEPPGPSLHNEAAPVRPGQLKPCQVETGRAEGQAADGGTSEAGGACLKEVRMPRACAADSVPLAEVPLPWTSRAGMHAAAILCGTTGLCIAVCIAMHPCLSMHAAEEPARLPSAAEQLDRGQD